MTAVHKHEQQTPKYILALTYFVQNSMNRLDALNLYGDTCLNTTVSALVKEHGFTFIKKMEPHLNQTGGSVRFTRYWLADESKERAHQLIKLYQPNTPK